MSTNIIAAHEGQQVHNSLIDALVAQEMRRQRSAQLEAALAGKKGAEDEAQLMRRAYRAYWKEKIVDARIEYGRNPEPSRAAEYALIAWACVAMAFDALFRAVGSGKA